MRIPDPDTSVRWADIPGTDGLYRASTLGEIRRARRLAVNGSLLREATVTAQVSPDGYASVRIIRYGKRRDIRVHRLVLETFVGERPTGYQCRHLDGNPLNNRLVNLRWGTPTENGADKRLHGKARKALATLNRCSRSEDRRRQA